MSAVDELIKQLREADGAEFDSTGQFSLDREKAREKMRQFQLPDPHRYVAVLVEAAVLKGATRIEFHIDADDMLMSFDGEPFSTGDVDELYTSLFVERAETAILARRELAVGLNAVMALNPRRVSLESGNAKGKGVRVTLHPSGPDDIEEVGDGLTPGTQIHVRARYRPGLVLEFFRDLSGTIAEEVVLRDRCAFAATEIYLDGKRVSFGLTRDLVGAVEFSGAGYRGVIGLGQDRFGTVVMLSRGVKIVETMIKGWPPYVSAMVDCTHLEKDVSQSDFLRDQHFEGVVQAMRSQLVPVMAKLVGRLEARDTTGFWSASRLHELVVGQFHGLSRPELLSQPMPLRRLADIPAWRTIGKAWLSTAQIIAENHEMGVPYVVKEKHFEGYVPSDWPSILGPRDGKELQSLKRTFGSRALDVTSKLHHARERERNRRAWRARVQAPRLPAGAWWRRTVVDDGAGLEGEIGLRAGDGMQIRLLVEGCLLCSLELDVGLDGVVAVVEGGLRTNRAFDGVKHDESLARIGMAMLSKLAELFAHAGSRAGGVPPALAYMRAVTAKGFAPEFMQGLGFSAKGARRWLEKLPVPGLLSSSVEEAGALADLRVFQAIGRLVSLREIDAEVAASPQGRVRWLAANQEVHQMPPFMILRVDSADRRVLRHFFGADALVEGVGDYGRFVAKEAFMRKPTAPLPEPPPSHAWVRTPEGETTGWVAIDLDALAEWGPGQSRKAEIAVRLQGRPLGLAKLSSPLPATRAVLEGPLVEPNPTFDGASNAWVLRKAVLATQVRILDAVIGTGDGVSSVGQSSIDQRRRQLLMASLTLAFPNPVFAQAYRELEQTLEADALEHDYEQLLALVPRVSLRDATAALELAMEDGQPPQFQQVVDLLEVGRKKKRSAAKAQKLGPSRAFTHEVLVRLPMLMDLGLLVNADRAGPPISLRMLERSVERDPKIGWVERHSQPHRHEDRTIAVVGDCGRDLLRRVWGEAHLEQADSWLASRAHAHAFTNRQEIDLRLRSEECLVAVDVEHDGIVGQIGIPRTDPTARHAHLTLCTQRRQVEVVPFTFQLPLVGVLDDPQLPVSDDFSSVRRTERTVEIANLGVRSTDRLMLLVADQFAAKSPSDRRQLEAWILRYLQKNAVGSNGDPDRVSRVCAALFELPLFSDVFRRPLSISDMARALVDGKLRYVRAAEGHSVSPEGTVVLLDRHFAEVGALFWSLEDYEPRWAELERGALRRRQARVVDANRIPDDALCSTDVDWDGGHSLAGRLWLRVDGHGDRIDFHEEGRVVESRELVGHLPVGGVISGSFEIDADFTRGKLDPRATDHLLAMGCRLYELLVAEEVAVEGARDRRPPHRAHAVRRTLASLAMDLHGRASGTRPPQIERLYKSVRTVPVFELGTGRRISLALALRSRPVELAHLGLWQGASAESNSRGPVHEGGSVQSPARPAAPQADVGAPGGDGLGLLAALMGGMLGGPSDSPLNELPKMDVPDTLPHAGEVEESPPAAVKAPTARVVLLERVRAELKLARQDNEHLLADQHLDSVRCEHHDGLRVAGFDDKGVFIDLSHPLVQTALESGEREPVAISLLASSVYTGLNRWLSEITDAQEDEFHRLHTAYLVSRA